MLSVGPRKILIFFLFKIFFNITFFRLFIVVNIQFSHLFYYEHSTVLLFCALLPLDVFSLFFYFNHKNTIGIFLILKRKINVSVFDLFLNLKKT